MYLLIEDPEWLQLRQEEILAIENYNLDRWWLLLSRPIICLWISQTLSGSPKLWLTVVGR